MTVIKKETKKFSLDEMKERDKKMVRGKFIFHEVPGGVLPFNYKRYKGEPIERYELLDGQIYTLPLGVARHLNTNCAYPVYEYIPGEKGVMQGMLVDPVTGVQNNMRIGVKVRRCSFQSLEFTEFDDEMAYVPEGRVSTIATVEKA